MENRWEIGEGRQWAFSKERERNASSREAIGRVQKAFQLFLSPFFFARQHKLEKGLSAKNVATNELFQTFYQDALARHCGDGAGNGGQGRREALHTEVRRRRLSHNNYSKIHI